MVKHRRNRLRPWRCVCGMRRYPCAVARLVATPVDLGEKTFKLPDGWKPRAWRKKDDDFSPMNHSGRWDA